MSLRDEMMRAVSSHPLDDCAATDAALDIVRAHANQLADKLELLAVPLFEFGMNEGYEDAARLVRALCEEQTEDEK